jgi:hypothetical protein
MKRAWVVLSFLCVGAPEMRAAASTVEAWERSDFYGVFLSDAPDNPNGWSGEPHAGVDTLYVRANGTRDALALEFAFTGTYEVIDVIPSEGVENVGSIQEPVFIGQPPGNCLPYSLVAAVIVEDAVGAGAELCLGESSGGRFCFLMLDYPKAWYGVTHWRGYTTIESFPCFGEPSSSGCASLAIDPGSWGKVKALYR